MEFHLVADWTFVRCHIAQEKFHGGAGVIRSADVDDFSGLLEFTNFCPRLEKRFVDIGHRVGIPLVARATWRMHVRPGPVVQIKVDLLDAEILKRFV